MDVNGLGESRREAQGRAAGKELASALGNKEWKSSSPVSPSADTSFFLISDTSFLCNVLFVVRNPDTHPEARCGGHCCLQGHQAAGVCPGLCLLPDTSAQLPGTSMATRSPAQEHSLPPSPPPAHSLLLEEEIEILELFTLQLTPVPQIKTVRTANPKNVSLILHYSKALFCSEIFSLLRQRHLCCTRSPSSCLSLSLHLSSLLLLFFPSVFGAEEVEMKHRLLTLPAGSELPKPVDLIQSLHFFARC